MKHGLIGEKLPHSLSKVIYEKMGLDYSLCEIRKEDVEGVIKGEVLTDFNVTIPYKQEVMKYVDVLDETAKEIGAVNTVTTKNGKRIGYNTDAFGMELLIKRIGVDLLGKTVAILGSGGTSNTAKYVANKLGAGKIFKVSRSGEINYENCYDYYVDYVINTTPVGTYPNVYDCPVDLSKWKGVKGVLDVVYNPLNTSLVSSAKKLGIKTEGGLYMLVAQAIKAISIFYEKPLDYSLIDKIYGELKGEFANIVLIGMPSSGKSLIGKEIAKLTGKKFIDLDKEYEKQYSTTPKSDIETYGEMYFRDRESNVVKNVKEGGLVIATGGGVIKRENNMDALKRNGVIVYLDRALEKLEVSGRPLSKKEGVEKLYLERKPLYEKYADIVVKNDDMPENVAKEVLNQYEKSIGN
ncbi:MAG: shikimate kinase [Clostridia bacterium]|nr:shikimate kinase [Clostridia bacterium]MDY5263787.1 shikimate kinase [Eubacteriales bacterium]